MIFHFKQKIDSTQSTLTSLVRSGSDMDLPYILAARLQTNGIGSRANSWDMVDCGLYVSIAISRDFLPSDLPMQSSSVYFGYVLLKIFRNLYKDSDLWLKWPNDFYLRDSKIGGIMTSHIKNTMIFGFGLNLFSSSYTSIFSTKGDEDLLEKPIFAILKFLGFDSVESLSDNLVINCNKECLAFKDSMLDWKSIFLQYKQEFHRNHSFYAHVDIHGERKKVSLSDALLCDDAGIMIDDVVIYSLR